MNKTMLEHDYFMKMALDHAEQALAEGEFPVGCVIAHQEELIATGARTGSRLNSGERTVPSEIDHAEINALKSFYDLDISIPREEITLYCTLEPCLMCFGAIMISRIGTLVFAYEDVMGGGTSCDLKTTGPLYADSRIEIIPHVMRNESLKLFKTFFSNPDNDYWKESLLADYTIESAYSS